MLYGFEALHPHMVLSAAALSPLARDADVMSAQAQWYQKPRPITNPPGLL